jgi:transcription antitermination factor NusG
MWQVVVGWNMSFEQMPVPKPFRVGQKVIVKDGTFVGTVGEVIDFQRAREILNELGSPRAVNSPVATWVLLSVFGRHVPVALHSFQIEARDDF